MRLSLFNICISGNTTLLHKSLHQKLECKHWSTRTFQVFDIPAQTCQLCWQHCAPYVFIFIALYSFQKGTKTCQFQSNSALTCSSDKTWQNKLNTKSCSAPLNWRHWKKLCVHIATINSRTKWSSYQVAAPALKSRTECRQALRGIIMPIHQGTEPSAGTDEWVSLVSNSNSERQKKPLAPYLDNCHVLDTWRREEAPEDVLQAGTAPHPPHLIDFVAILHRIIWESLLGGGLVSLPKSKLNFQMIWN